MLIRCTVQALLMVGKIVQKNDDYRREAIRKKASVGENGNYEVEYTAERSTLGFNDLRSSSQVSSESINSWLAGRTGTYRHLTYR